VIALIPARRGSKRFPGKNRAKFKGVSFLELACRAATNSEVIDQVYISTNDEELIKEATTLGIIVPFIRSESLSGDDTSSWEVVRDFISRTNYSGDICLLQLTSPKRNESDIRKLSEIFFRESPTQSLTVVKADTETGQNWSWYCDCRNQLSTVQHCQNSVTVVPNGGAYMLNSVDVSGDSFKNLSGLHAYLMPKARSLDIDFKHQLDLAEEES
jgi:CMP-N-acetylneuraminic acid synthetase